MNYLKFKRPVPISSLLTDRSQQLHVLVTRAQHLRELTKKLRGLLPAPLANHVVVANITETTLVLAADSPIWMTKLRYYTPKLLANFQIRQPALPNLTQVRLRINPPVPVPVLSYLPPNAISGKAATHISSVANDLNDMKLKQALLRLAKRPEKDNK